MITKKKNYKKLCIYKTILNDNFFYPNSGAIKIGEIHFCHYYEMCLHGLPPPHLLCFIHSVKLQISFIQTMTLNN